MKKITLMLLSLLFILGCQTNKNVHPMFEPAHYHQEKEFSTFQEYLTQTEQKILATRFFQTANKAQELAANMPFELKPEIDLPITKAVLLVHGLGDSPFSFIDVGQVLAKQGYLVRTILLDGHGTRPGNLIHASYEVWQEQVARHVELLKEEVDEIYLGGFSTGGNLTYLYAMGDVDIKGLMLFSPGFQSDEPKARFAPLAAYFTDWLYDISNASEPVYTRYLNTPTNGFGEYYKTSAAAMKQLKKETYNKPTFMVLTEHDSVLDVRLIRELFSSRFTHPNNKLVWFGTDKSKTSNQITTIHSRVPQLRISNMSHMGVLFSPDNTYYGIDGVGRICRNGQKEGGFEYCAKGGEVWYGAYGTQEEGQVVARLTFNPEFNLMMNELNKVFTTK